MKRLGLAVAALLVSATMSYAQSYHQTGKEPFPVSLGSLDKYLNLEADQIDKVADINDFFLEKQNESLYAKASLKEKKMHEAVYGNLKLMKQTLTHEQYRKYLLLINVTNNNLRVLGSTALPNSPLAVNTQK